VIPEPGQTSITLSGLIILLGVVQGVLLSITFLVQKQATARLKGLIFLCFTLIITEMFLNRTGYMYYVIQLVDFSEPVQFAVPPLVYLAVRNLDHEYTNRKWWLHFIPFLAYTLYFIPFFIAPAGFKQESYYSIHHIKNLDFPAEFEFYLKWGMPRKFQLQAFNLQSTIYLILSFQYLSALRKDPSGLKINNIHPVNWWILFCILFSVLIVVVVAVKILFIKDLGDHIIAIFVTLTLYLSTIWELIKHPEPLPETNAGSNLLKKPQYTQSGVNEGKSSEIKERLIQVMEHDKPYTDPLITLPKLAKKIGEPPYIVSRVINDKVGVSFYDWIASYRVDEAKRLFSDPSKKLFTIEQVAEEVGYNSKSAFNKAFKKFTGRTPSEFRNS
jgi:AraC-like DNA-binding protein